MNCAFAKQALLVALGSIVAGLPGTASTAAESGGGALDEQTVKRELEELNDPTIFVRRIWLETEWNGVRGGSDNAAGTRGFSW